MFCRIFVSRRFLCYYSSSLKTEIIYPDNEPEKKLLKIAILGAPNAGKSTLVNSLVGRRVCSESKKVHTTRSNLKAIGVDGQTQLIFLDTPGVVSSSAVKRHNLDNSFESHPKKAVVEADIIGFVHDVSNKWLMKRLDWNALQLLGLHRDKPSFLILNKIDILRKKHKLFEIVKALTNNSLESFMTDKNTSNREPTNSNQKKSHSWSHFSDVFMVSALTNDGVSDIKKYLLQQAKSGPWIYKNNEFTDKTPENIILQTVQSRLLEYLPEEVPYLLSTEMEYFEVKPDGRIIAVVLLTCPALRTQKLVLGRGGQRIKWIAREAEQLVKNTFLEEVFLKIVVRTDEKSK